MFREYRVPRSDGEVLVDPPLSRIAEILRSNRRRSGQKAQAIDWDTLRRHAREQLITAAIHYTSAYRDTNWVQRGDSPTIIMAGHQPTLFHPGVWFKNFALSHLADTHGGLAINLVIDNDVAPAPAIRVPWLDSATSLARFESVAYDTGGGGVPHEQMAISDRDRFDQFDRSVRRVIAPLVGDPCVSELWVHAREAIARCGVAGCALAQARHRLEMELGLRTLEVPLGVVTRGVPFARFALAILREPADFRQSYNESVEAYRSAHGIRSKAHPVPNLASDGEWVEAPLWLYGDRSPMRRGVWARRQGDRLWISDRVDRELELDVRDEERAAEALAAAACPDFKLRPRALLTTIYARLVLSDLFLHGIGGGKYDQLGDQVIRAHFDIEPPQFMVISATHLLPGVDPPRAEQEVRRLRQAIRESRFHPERFADQFRSEAEGDASWRALEQRKRELLDDLPPRGERLAWHRELTSLNEQLAAALSDFRFRLQSQLTAARRRAASEQVLASREHSFCLYPLEDLHSAFTRMLGSAVE